MNIHEVQEKLKEMGIEVTVRTIQRYAKEGLIPKPKRKAAGRGKGKISKYADNTPEAFYENYQEMHRPVKRNLKRWE